MAACQTVTPSTGSVDPIKSARLASLKVPPAESMIGQRSDELTELVGAPGLVRKEKGVSVLQFAQGDCVLLAYVYDTPEGRVVKHLDALAKGPTGGAFDIDGCLRVQAEAHVLNSPSS